MKFGYARPGAVQLLEQQRWIGDSVRRSYDRWLTAKYALNWKLFSNPASGRAFRRDPPRLDAGQDAVVDRLRRDGLALIPFGEMVRNPELLRQLDEAAGEFAQSPIVQDALQGYCAPSKKPRNPPQRERRSRKRRRPD